MVQESGVLLEQEYWWGDYCESNDWKDLSEGRGDCFYKTHFMVLINLFYRKIIDKNSYILIAGWVLVYENNVSIIKMEVNLYCLSIKTV